MCILRSLSTRWLDYLAIYNNESWPNTIKNAKVSVEHLITFPIRGNELDFSKSNGKNDTTVPQSQP